MHIEAERKSIRLVCRNNFIKLSSIIMEKNPMSGISLYRTETTYLKEKKYSFVCEETTRRTENLTSTVV